MKSKFGSVLVLVACGALAGCGGGSSGGGSSEAGAPGFADLESQGEALLLEAASLDITDAASLPTTGSARYEGVMGVEVYGDELVTLAGDLTMDVDFAAADPISGSVTNFVDSEEARYSGSLALGASTVDRGADPATTWQFGVDIAGTITDPDGIQNDVDGLMVGDFLGTQHGYAGGEVFGDTCSDLGCAEFDGVFIAKR